MLLKDTQVSAQMPKVHQSLVHTKKRILASWCVTARDVFVVRGGGG